MIDYSIFYKEELPAVTEWGPSGEWDVFLSAFIPSERTRRVFTKAHASYKKWLIFSEYCYSDTDYPSSGIFYPRITNEAEFISALWDSLPSNTRDLRICIDISGFIRPYLIFLVRWLFEKGVEKFDAIYTEPIQYRARELTEFSDAVVTSVRQISGCEGNHVPDISKDVLVLGSGYEDSLIANVSENKAKATKLQLLGFPSLRADMYQENVLRVARVEDSLGLPFDDSIRTFFAPANDPFLAAAALQHKVNEWKTRKGITNLYLSPLSTKAHVLGFTLYYLSECLQSPVSIIFPFEERYRPNTSTGIARIWKFRIELPIVKTVSYR